MARQKLGQHFLISAKALERISAEACGERAELVVEVGPGRGALTEYLLRRAGRVVAIELDSELVEHLRDRWRDEPRLEIVETNALHVNWASFGVGVLAGNLPYYIATAIISSYLRNPGQLTQGVFLIQKEVAERITARPRTRDYGYFSVECQTLATVEHLTTVAPGAFRPPPKVDSAVIRLRPRPQEPGVSVEKFLSFVSVCFRQKRKTLLNNLSGLYAREALARIPGLGRRAEELTTVEFQDLHRLLAAESETSDEISSAS